MTAEEILAKAAELVDTSWAQGPDGEFSYVHGPYCAGIALQIAAAGQLDSVVSAARTAFSQEIGVDLSEIPIWNDTPGRSVHEVAGALRNAKRWLPS